MKQIIEELNLELQKDINLLNEVEFAIKQAPEGTLEVQTVRGKLRFFKRTNEKKEYVSTTERIFIALCNKRFCSQIMKITEKKIKGLKKCLKILKSLLNLKTPSMVYEKLPTEIKTNIALPKNTDEGFAQFWQSKKFICKDPDDASFKTLRGDLVRSKTELIIADKLFNAKIPYHYEVATQSDIGRLYPDFYILNKRTRKTYLWEHFGKMDDPEYCKKTLLKIEAYERLGFRLGKNFIATFESSLYHIRTEQLDNIIVNYFK